MTETAAPPEWGAATVPEWRLVPPPARQLHDLAWFVHWIEGMDGTRHVAAIRGARAMREREAERQGLCDICGIGRFHLCKNDTAARAAAKRIAAAMLVWRTTASR